MSKNTMSELVKPQAKGQITIPARFRRALGLNSDTYLRVTLEGRQLVLTPVRIVEEGGPAGREYTQDEIEAFFAADQLDADTVAKIKRLLGRE